jgi:hypothetical protein
LEKTIHKVFKVVKAKAQSPKVAIGLNRLRYRAAIFPVLRISDLITEQAKGGLKMC